MADPVILGRDLTAVADHNEITDVAVTTTICGGRAVFQAGE
ncbi:MAG: hypothetical protein Q8S27_03760 [Hoeflea sp.]|nr:hypothetical protein [Hoeflea sp.]